MQRLKYTAERFTFVHWNKEDIKRELETLLQETRDAYEVIKNIPAEERTFENTPYALNTSHHGFWRSHVINLLMNVSPSEEIRNVAAQELEKFEKALVDIEYDQDIYRALKEYAALEEEIFPSGHLVGDRWMPSTTGRQRDAGRENLSQSDKKLLSDMLREYRRMGFDLPKEEQAKLKENLKKISELSTRFQKNINDYQDSIIVTREELDGLPEHYIHHLRQDESGNYLVTLEYPDLHPFMENAKNAEKRRELSLKYLRKGGPENISLAQELLRLRHENALLLGYPNHAAYRIETKMAKQTETVMYFLNTLTERIAPALKQELALLTEKKRQLTSNHKTSLEHSELAYLTNQHKKELHGIDTEKLREYFPFSQVKEGLFGVYQQLFSLRFERIPHIKLWHTDAALYAVKPADRNDEILAYFILDLYPREGKYGHAAAFNMISGHTTTYQGKQYVTPLACMVANFPKPGSDHDSLMSHDEIETFFHEFGHILHEILTQVAHISQSGFSVAWDFVETPSQMFESWAWDKDVLRSLSSHYQTGEVLPDKTIDQLIASRHHMTALSTMRQLCYTLLDMQLHTEQQNLEADPNLVYNQLYEQSFSIPFPKNTSLISGFGHFAGGYDAGYYGYLWARVYAADLFSVFQKEGVLNEATGKRFLETLLSQGSSDEEMNLVKAFLGREPSQDAFLKELGIK